MAALEDEGSSAEILLRMITGFQLTQAISVAGERAKSSDTSVNPP